MYNNRDFIYTIESLGGSTLEIRPTNPLKYNYSIIDKFNPDEFIKLNHIENVIYETYIIAFLQLHLNIETQAAMKLFVRVWIWDGRDEKRYLQGYKASYEKLRDFYIRRKSEFFNTNAPYALFNLAGIGSE